MMLRRHRTLKALAEDPRGDFMVGRLLGAAEMVALHLQLSGEPRWQAMGDHLDTVAGWFLDGVQDAPRRRLAPGEAETFIKPPRGTTGPQGPSGVRDPESWTESAE